MRRPTRKIFKEYNPDSELSLGEWRTAFVELCDPTEYDAAIALAGSWEEWSRFKKEWPDFRDRILPEWLEEVEIKIRSEAVKSLCHDAKTGKNPAASAKWLAEGKYTPKQAGRPTKSAIQKEARIAAGVTNEAEDDITRVLESVNKDHTRMN